MWDATPPLLATQGFKFPIEPWDRGGERDGSDEVGWQILLRRRYPPSPYMTHPSVSKTPEGSYMVCPTNTKEPHKKMRPRGQGSYKTGRGYIKGGGGRPWVPVGSNDGGRENKTGEWDGGGVGVEIVEDGDQDVKKGETGELGGGIFKPGQRT